MTYLGYGLSVSAGDVRFGLSEKVSRAAVESLEMKGAVSEQKTRLEGMCPADAGEITSRVRN